MTPGGASPVAEAEGLCLDRGGHRVLDGVTLALRAGTVTLLVGANGAGKTTLMRILAGGLAATGGRVRVLGRDPRRTREARQVVGLVPQEIALYPRLTVRENVAVFAAYAGASATPALLERCLGRTGLSAVADMLVGRLSGGYQRRANIACALVGAPRLLLLDEPLVGLDPLARRAIATDLKRLARADGVALLIATHDLDEGEAIADAVAVLHRGRIAAHEAPAALTARLFPPAARHVEVTLSEAPDGRTRDRLDAHRLAPTDEPTVWRCIDRTGDGAAVLDPAGLGQGLGLVREMRVRRLGLGDAYAAIVAEAVPS